ncbi:hypothetical protein AG1IA_02814 [Rhizoctonia solani AG-1 IA]|uniref:Uncharacterized protein n=1 Tax=Thanatephorus cucumeris (strain AG1-IA) TaxID=983506 RepID=L8X3F9_THACA|nr:hypothetical protein AG1IA_02814 [Rhizoctonia solani AG-1 IA]
MLGGRRDSWRATTSAPSRTRSRFPLARPMSSERVQPRRRSSANWMKIFKNEPS